MLRLKEQSGRSALRNNAHCEVLKCDFVLSVEYFIELGTRGRRQRTWSSLPSLSLQTATFALRAALLTVSSTGFVFDGTNKQFQKQLLLPCDVYPLNVV